MASRLAGLGLALALTAAPAVAATAPVDTAKQIEALVLAGKADEAVDKGRAALAANPDDVDLRLALARALAAKARRFNHVVNVKLSQEALDKGQLTVPGANLGDSPLQVGYDPALFEEAILNLDEGIKRAPKREDLRVFECFLLTDSGRTDRARAAIESALAALPKTPELAKTLAAYAAERTKRNDPEGGAKLLEPVAAAFPRDAAVQSDYGNILTRLGRKNEAEDALDRATILAPENVRYARTRAMSAMLLRDFKRAQSAFDAVFRLARDPQDQFAGNAAAYGIDPKASVALMRELAYPSPSVDAAEADLANLFALAGTAGPASPAALGLARKLVDNKQYILAIPVLDRALKADPKLADAKAMLAKTYKELGCERLAR